MSLLPKKGKEEGERSSSSSSSSSFQDKEGDARKGQGQRKGQQENYYSTEEVEELRRNYKEQAKEACIRARELGFTEGYEKGIEKGKGFNINSNESSSNWKGEIKLNSHPNVNVNGGEEDNNKKVISEEEKESLVRYILQEAYTTLASKLEQEKIRNKVVYEFAKNNYSQDDEDTVGIKVSEIKDQILSLVKKSFVESSKLLKGDEELAQLYHGSPPPPPPRTTTTTTTVSISPPSSPRASGATKIIETENGSRKKDERKEDFANDKLEIIRNSKTSNIRMISSSNSRTSRRRSSLLNSSHFNPPPSSSSLVEEKERKNSDFFVSSIFSFENYNHSYYGTLQIQSKKRIEVLPFIITATNSNTLPLGINIYQQDDMQKISHSKQHLFQGISLTDNNGDSLNSNTKINNNNDNNSTDTTVIWYYITTIVQQIDLSSNLPIYRMSYTVKRRYREFDVLYKRLVSNFPEVFVPPLPPKESLLSSGSNPAGKFMDDNDKVATDDSRLYKESIVGKGSSLTFSDQNNLEYIQKQVYKQDRYNAPDFHKIEDMNENIDKRELQQVKIQNARYRRHSSFDLDFVDINSLHDTLALSNTIDQRTNIVNLLLSREDFKLPMFLLKRKAALQCWLKYVCKHPIILYRSTLLQEFLTMTPATKSNLAMIKIQKDEKEENDNNTEKPIVDSLWTDYITLNRDSNNNNNNNNNNHFKKSESNTTTQMDKNDDDNITTNLLKAHKTRSIHAYNSNSNTPCKNNIYWFMNEILDEEGLKIDYIHDGTFRQFQANNEWENEDDNEGSYRNKVNHTSIVNTLALHQYFHHGDRGYNNKSDIRSHKREEPDTICGYGSNDSAKDMKLGIAEVPSSSSTVFLTDHQLKHTSALRTIVDTTVIDMKKLLSLEREKASRVVDSGKRVVRSLNEISQTFKELQSSLTALLQVEGTLLAEDMNIVFEKNKGTNKENNMATNESMMKNTINRVYSRKKEHDSSGLNIDNAKKQMAFVFNLYRSPFTKPQTLQKDEKMHKSAYLYEFHNGGLAYTSLSALSNSYRYLANGFTYTLISPLQLYLLQHNDILLKAIEEVKGNQKESRVERMDILVKEWGHARILRHLSLNSCFASFVGLGLQLTRGPILENNLIPAFNVYRRYAELPPISNKVPSYIPRVQLQTDFTTAPLTSLDHQDHEDEEKEKATGDVVEKKDVINENQTFQELGSKLHDQDEQDKEDESRSEEDEKYRLSESQSDPEQSILEKKDSVDIDQANLDLSMNEDENYTQLSNLTGKKDHQDKTQRILSPEVEYPTDRSSGFWPGIYTNNVYDTIPSDDEIESIENRNEKEEIILKNNLNNAKTVQITKEVPKQLAVEAQQSRQRHFSKEQIMADENENIDIIQDSKLLKEEMSESFTIDEESQVPTLIKEKSEGKVGKRLRGFGFFDSLFNRGSLSESGEQNRQDTAATTNINKSSSKTDFIENKLSSESEKSNDIRKDNAPMENSQLPSKNSKQSEMKKNVESLSELEETIPNGIKNRQSVKTEGELKSMDKEKEKISSLDCKNTYKDKEKEISNSRGRSSTFGRKSGGSKVGDELIDTSDSALSLSSVVASKVSAAKISKSIDSPFDYVNKVDEEVEGESLMDKYIRQQKEAYERETKLREQQERNRMREELNRQQGIHDDIANMRKKKKKNTIVNSISINNTSTESSSVSTPVGKSFVVSPGNSPSNNLNPNSQSDSGQNNPAKGSSNPYSTKSKGQGPTVNIRPGMSKKAIRNTQIKQGISPGITTTTTSKNVRVTTPGSFNGSNDPTPNTNTSNNVSTSKQKASGRWAVKDREKIREKEKEKETLSTNKKRTSSTNTSSYFDDLQPPSSGVGPNVMSGNTNFNVNINPNPRTADIFRSSVHTTSSTTNDPNPSVSGKPNTSFGISPKAGPTKVEKKMNVNEFSSVFSASPKSTATATTNNNNTKDSSSANTSIPPYSETTNSKKSVDSTPGFVRSGNSTSDTSSPVDIGGGWEEVKLPDGRSYYYHKLTRVSRWDKPSEESIRQIEERIAKEKKATEEQIARRKREMEIAKMKKEAEEENNEEINKFVKERMKLWARGKDVYSLINNAKEVYTPCPIPDPPLSRLSKPAQIRSAYHKLVRIIHPDKLTNEEMEIKCICTHLFTLITDQYNAVMNK